MRRSILHGMMAAAVTSVLGVEVLSALGLIRQLPLLLLSAAAILVFALVLRSQVRTMEPTAWTRPAHPFLLSCLIGIGGITLLVALLSAPNSWDSMSYHMARVAQWYDHGSVEHYFTGIDRQLWQPPFGEFLVLLGYGALGGRDYLANLPQWLAGLGVVLVVMEIATVLGASVRSRYIVALFTATAPIVILQSSSTLTDLLGAFWLACAAWLALSQFLTPGFGVRDALWFAVALGLAIGTKGTSLPLGLPWVFLFLLPSLRLHKVRAAVVQVAVIGLVVLLLNGEHFLRNFAVFGNPIGPETAQQMLRPASMGFSSLFSNLVAHLTLQLGTPWDGVNDLLSRTVATLHAALGVDLATLYPFFGGFRIFGWNTSEDLAGNLVHTFLGLVAVVLLILSWRRISRPERWAAGSFVAGVLFFALTVRWQPFIARLHTPILVLLAPCLLLLIDRHWPRVSTAGLVAALLLALPPLLLNYSRPLLPARTIGWKGLPARSIFVETRDAQYFAHRTELYAPYRSAIDSLTRVGCNRLAVKANYDSWEYPLWALGRDQGVRVEHLRPSNPEGISGSAADAPCALVGLDQPAGWRPASVSREAPPLVSMGPVTVWR